MICHVFSRQRCWQPQIRQYYLDRNPGTLTTRFQDWTYRANDPLDVLVRNGVCWTSFRQAYKNKGGRVGHASDTGLTPGMAAALLVRFDSLSLRIVALHMLGYRTATSYGLVSTGGMLVPPVVGISRCQLQF